MISVGPIFYPWPVNILTLIAIYFLIELMNFIIEMYCFKKFRGDFIMLLIGLVSFYGNRGCTQPLYKFLLEEVLFLDIPITFQFVYPCR